MKNDIIIITTAAAAASTAAVARDSGLRMSHKKSQQRAIIIKK